MNIEIGSKWVKDGEVVEVKALTSSILLEVVWYSKNDDKEHVLTKDDFLEQYKPYEVVYEYRWVICKENCEIGTAYYTDKEAEKEFRFYSKKQRLDFTKRERKQ